MKSIIATVAITLTMFTGFAQEPRQKQTELSAEKLKQAVELFKTRKAEDIPLLKEYQHKARLLKVQFDELLPKFKEQQEKVKEADKAYARAKIPKIKTGNDREKVGWYYTGDPSAVFPMSKYENRRKGRWNDSRIKYKSYTPEELAPAVNEAKEKLDAEKKTLGELQAQLKKLREDYRTNTQEYKQKLEEMLQRVQG